MEDKCISLFTDKSLVLSAVERLEVLQACPGAEPYVRNYVGSKEFINSSSRWCLWLVDAPAQLMRGCKEIIRRVEKNREYRQASGRAATVALAAQPGLFGEIRQPISRYLLVPKVSSENRPYMPVGFMPATVIASGSCLVVPGANVYHLGIIQSEMHMVWMRTVAGRMKSDYQYSGQLVYNNFPWPQDISEAKHEAIETAAQAVLDARKQHPEATLADLYDPLTMPPALLKAHRTLDKAVDAAYSRKKFTGDADRVAFLFEEYAKLASLLPPDKPRRRRQKA